MTDKAPHDAILLISFGGPEGPDDVVPFLENVTRGRNIPRERLEQVGEHYFLFGGVSPINEQCRMLKQALERELGEQGPNLPVYWGNRNWHPMLEETVKQMASDGIRRAVALATSAFSSYSACRMYLEDIERARTAAGENAPAIEKLSPYWNHPGFIETMAENTRTAIERSKNSSGCSTPQLVFTAHSIPAAMADNCDYADELAEASALIAERADGDLEFDLVYQSRSGPPTQPWLEPDVSDHLRELKARGHEAAVIVPVGFVSDHMEVIYDLDTEAKSVADEIGLDVQRAATVGAAPRFVAALRDLIVCHMDGRPHETVGTRGPRPWPCRPGCCAYTPGRPPTSARS
jgi:ferrochelatase